MKVCVCHFYFILFLCIYKNIIFLFYSEVKKLWHVLTAQDWLRFSMVFWHTFHRNGGDPFGALTKSWPWEDGINSIAMAKRRSKPNNFLYIFVRTG